MCSGRSALGRHAVLQTVCTEEHALNRHSEHPKRAQAPHSSTQFARERNHSNGSHVDSCVLCELEKVHWQPPCMCANSHLLGKLQHSASQEPRIRHTASLHKIADGRHTRPCLRSPGSDTALGSASSSRTYMSCSHLLRPCSCLPAASRCQSLSHCLAGLLGVAATLRQTCQNYTQFHSVRYQC